MERGEAQWNGALQYAVAQYGAVVICRSCCHLMNRCVAMRGDETRLGAVHCAETRGVVMPSGAVRRDAKSVLLDAHNIKAAIIAIVARAETAKADEFSGTFQNVLENGACLIGCG